jgi:hypothetical protein
MKQKLSTIYYPLAPKRQTLSLVIGTLFACACIIYDWSLVLVPVPVPVPVLYACACKNKYKYSRFTLN